MNYHIPRDRYPYQDPYQFPLSSRLHLEYHRISKMIDDLLIDFPIDFPIFSYIFPLQSGVELKLGNQVLIHCTRGDNRAPAVAAAALAAFYGFLAAGAGTWCGVVMTVMS